MAKFQLQDKEILVGSAMMAYKHKKSITREPTRGNIYVTNQRVCYYESWSNFVYMDLALSDIVGYDTKKVIFANFVYLYDRDNKCYAFSGLHAKNLIIWLEKVGIRKI